MSKAIERLIASKRIPTTVKVANPDRTLRGFEWQIGSAFVVDDEKNVWHRATGTSFNKVIPLHAKSIKARLAVCERIETNCADDVALLAFGPWGGFTEKNMMADIVDIARSIRTFALSC